mmetsp:Transcript_2667/g.4976  ORF Transcript_2667/g.4976 Transcript_2667/m.4976 type:complete len:240 (-) Transcript_2667:1212-1931(-)
MKQIIIIHSYCTTGHMTSMEIRHEKVSPFLRTNSIMRWISNDNGIILSCLFILVKFHLHLFQIKPHDNHSHQYQKSRTKIYHTHPKNCPIAVILESKSHLIHFTETNTGSLSLHNLQSFLCISKLSLCTFWTWHPFMNITNSRSLQEPLHSHLSLGILIRSKIHKVGNIHYPRQKHQNHNGSQCREIESNSQTKITHLTQRCRDGMIEFCFIFVFSWNGNIHFPVSFENLCFYFVKGTR